MKAVSAVPVYVPAPEIYQALQRGVLDAAAFSYGSAKAYRIDELVKYATSGLNFPGGGMAYAINEKVYKKLPDDVKKAMEKAGDETTKNLGNASETGNEKIKQEFIKKGMRIYKLSPQEQGQWKTLTKGLKAKWVSEMEKKGFPAQQTLDNYLKEIEKAR